MAGDGIVFGTDSAIACRVDAAIGGRERDDARCYGNYSARCSRSRDIHRGRPIRTPVSIGSRCHPGAPTKEGDQRGIIRTEAFDAATVTGQRLPGRSGDPRRRDHRHRGSPVGRPASVRRSGGGVRDASTVVVPADAGAGERRRFHRRGRTSLRVVTVWRVPAYGPPGVGGGLGRVRWLTVLPAGMGRTAPQRT